MENLYHAISYSYPNSSSYKHISRPMHSNAHSTHSHHQRCERKEISYPSQERIFGLQCNQNRCTSNRSTDSRMITRKRITRKMFKKKLAFVGDRKLRTLLIGEKLDSKIHERRQKCRSENRQSLYFIANLTSYYPTNISPYEK